MILASADLGALADNGGPTRTHRPNAGSRAIDGGRSTASANPTVDQRNFGPRAQGVAIDLGAVETNANPAAPPPPFAPPPPTSAPTATTVVIAPDGTGVVRISNADGTTRSTFTPYVTYIGSIVTASGDVTGDGIADVITGANGHVKVFDGITGAEVRSFFAFENYAGGIRVAAGDVTGDGVADIVVSADADGHVVVFDGSTGQLVRSFFAFDGYMGAVALAVGDLDGDGRNEIIAGAGTANGVHVKAFDGASLALNDSFMVAGSGDARFALAAGDLNQDGRADIIVAQGTRVRVFDGPTSADRGSFDAFEDAFLGPMGVRVDGGAILTIADTGGRSHVKRFDGQTFDVLGSFFVDTR